MRVLFLDLENTVIDDWYEGNFLLSRIEKIKEWIELESFCGNNFDCLGLFSWAVNDFNDLKTWEKQFKDMLESLFNLKFEQRLLYTVQDVKRLLCTNRRMKQSSVGDSEFFDVWSNKSLTFTEVCVTDIFRNTQVQHATLVDDIAWHNTVIQHEGKTIKLINPLQL